MIKKFHIGTLIFVNLFNVFGQDYFYDQDRSPIPEFQIVSPDSIKEIKRYTSGIGNTLPIIIGMPTKTKYQDMSVYYDSLNRIDKIVRLNMGGNTTEFVTFKYDTGKIIRINQFKVIKNERHHWLLKNTQLIEEGRSLDPGKVNYKFKLQYNDNGLTTLLKYNGKGKEIKRVEKKISITGKVNSIIYLTKGKIRFLENFFYDAQNQLNRSYIYKSDTHDIPHRTSFYTYNDEKLTQYETVLNKKNKQILYLTERKDQNENIIETSSSKNDSAKSHTFKYTYNERGKLTSEQYFISGAPVCETKYIYDKYGNILLKEKNRGRSFDWLEYQQKNYYNERGNITRTEIFDKDKGYGTLYKYDYVYYDQ